MPNRSLVYPRLLIATIAVVLSAAPAFATDFFVFKAGAVLPVATVIEQPAAPTDLFITRKLGPNQLINLALGRPLETKVDAKTEILAVAITFAEDAQLSKVIVFDPSQNGAAQVKATIAHLDTIELARGYKSNGQSGSAAATIAVQATVLGAPAQNGFLASTLHGAGSGGGPFGFGTPEKGAGKGIVTGRLRFHVAGGLFDGIVTQGKVKASGKRLGVFSE